MTKLFKIHASLIVLVLIFSLSASAHILPKNDLSKFDNKLRSASMTKEDFDYIIDHIIEMYASLAQKHGATLTAEHLWDDSTVNAFADENGKEWGVHFYGGLARRPEMTPDGFALVICHELGHHFGGYYFFNDSTNNWAAAEGEADYFATQACGRQVLAAAFMKKYDSKKKRAPDVAQQACDVQWTDPAARHACYRIANGSLALAKLLAAAGGETTTPAFETPDASTVDTTNTDHPYSQCRLDTYFQASLCSQVFDNDVIPGRNDTNGGTNDTISEQVAMKYTCFSSQGFKVGARPRCWFKPQL